MKVSIIGTGNVGTALAHAVVLGGLADELVLINRTAEIARGHQIDLQHTCSFVKHPISISSGPLEESAGSDVIVYTASAPMPRTMEDRQSLAEDNAKLVAQQMPTLAKLSPDAIFLMVSNPVDSLVWATLQVTDLPRERVCGIGTVVDSARFRILLSDHFEIHPNDVRAYILGEHGATQVAAISVASIGGEQIDASKPKAIEFAREAKESGFEILRLKGHTNFAVAQATAVVIEGIQHDQNLTLPLSVMLDGFNGIDDVCLSLPVVIGRQGITRTFHPSLTADEVAAFRESAATVRATNEKIKAFLPLVST